ncbi:hypothetical protein, partial [Enterococcus cecorum]|uniref:hypothetical protein n=1 Tax=Enterococcus cecorum TaxID=44008 RepID=UPI000DEB6D97
YQTHGAVFENDVNQYGYLTRKAALSTDVEFENDVNQYGYLTYTGIHMVAVQFENDVNQYGYLTLFTALEAVVCLRMM